MSTSEIVPSEQFDVVVAARRQAGVDMVDFTSVGIEPWDLHGSTVTGRVTTAADASAIVLCAARGADVVVAVEAELADALTHDLGRLGEVRRTASNGAADRVATLSDETVGVLLALADGCSVGEAAARCYMSERTAFRRVTAAKRALGVATTAEAVAAAVAVSSSGRPSR